MTQADGPAHPPATDGPGRTERQTGTTTMSTTETTTAETTKTAATATEPRSRRGLHWVVAAVAFAAVAAGSAYAVADRPRQDLPGLGTPGDGRLAYAPQALPVLPSGQAEPKAYARLGRGLLHTADLHQLLLAAPQDTRADRTLPGAHGGWLETDAYIHGRTAPGPLADAFADAGLESIAAAGWTTAGGTHTAVYLLRFPGARSAEDGLRALTKQSYPQDGESLAADAADAYPALQHARESGAEFTTFTQPAATDGEPALRDAYFTVGDVLVEVVARDPHEVSPVAFAQTVGLQYQRLTA